MILRLAAMVAASACVAITAAAQRAPQAFEAASITRNVSGAGSWNYGPQPGGAFAATNITLASLIELAHGVREDQVAGGPAWIRNERWDVAAKTNGEVPFETVRAMLRQLLTERFRLRLRREQRVMPLFELRLARADRRLGAGLRSVGKACATNSNEKLPPNVPARGSQSVITDNETTRGRCVPLSFLVANLSSRLEAAVVDRTGLTGVWDFDLTAAEQDDSADRTKTPSLFVALPEQLGLRLERGRGPVDVLNVLRAERPVG